MGPSILGYKNCKIHRVVKNFMVQGGDFLNSNGTGSMTIFKDENGKAKEMFEDENFLVKHSKAGLLCMANSGPNTNGSQFFLVYKDTTLEPNYTIWGKIKTGLPLLKRLEKVGAYKVDPSTGSAYYADDGFPIQPVEIQTVTIR